MDRLEVLRGSQLFEDLSDADLELILPLCSEESFEAGEVIFNEGDAPKKIYVVEHGKVALDLGLRFGSHMRRRVTIETATRGHPLGWSAVTTSDALTATARCLEKTEVLAIDGPGLRSLLDANPDMGLRVEGKLVNLVRSRLGNARDTLARILSIVSHDLRAPLHAVQSYHQVMLGGYAGQVSDKQRDMLARCGERIVGLLGLIDDILDLSRLDAGELQKVSTSLAAIAEASMENVRPQASHKGVRLVADWPGDLPDVRVQPARMQQVLTNLLSNAVKYAPQDSEIRVRIRAVGEKVTTEVMDTGPGIPEDELPHIFDDFYRGKSAGADGVGLGLAIAKKIVEAHNGRIWVESPYAESLKGAKFTFTLPRG